MKTMTFVLFTSATVCICVACGGDAQSDVANGVAAREDKALQLAQKGDTPKTAVDRKALPPIKEPVHESGEPKKLAVTFIHTRQMEGKSFTKGMSLARRNFGTLTGMYQYESVRQVHPNAPAELYLEMAVSYLVLGRFDTAIAYLERGQKKSPPKGSFARTYKTIYEHAKNVKATLTQARDALRKKGVDVKYPDERIFLQAFATAPANDHYLLMNIADA